MPQKRETIARLIVSLFLLIWEELPGRGLHDAARGQAAPDRRRGF